MTTAESPRPDSWQNTGDASTPSSGLLKIGGLLFLLVWTVTLIDGAWAYLFRRLLKTSSPSITGMLILVIFAFAFRLLFTRRSFVVGDRALASSAWAMCVYLLSAAIVHVNIQDVPVVLVLLGFHIAYFYLLVFSVSPVLSGSLSGDFVAKYLTLFGVVMASIAVAQTALGTLFSFGYYIAGSIDSITATTGGRVRGSALFNHSDDLGIFLCIPLCICIRQFILKRSRLERLVWLVGGLIILAGCFATLTRVVYIALLMTGAMTIWGCRRYKNPRIDRSRGLFPVWSPLLLCGVAVSLFFLRYVVEAAITSFDFLKDFRYLASSKSLDERLHGVAYYVHQISLKGIAGWIFGLGWTFRINMKALVPVDNGFLAVVLSIGFAGFAFWLWLSYRCWIILNRFASGFHGVLFIPVAAFFSIWLALSVFGAYLQPFMAAVLVVTTLTGLQLRNAVSGDVARSH